MIWERLDAYRRHPPHRLGRRVAATLACGPDGRRLDLDEEGRVPARLIGCLCCLPKALAGATGKHDCGNA